MRHFFLLKSDNSVFTFKLILQFKKSFWNEVKISNNHFTFDIQIFSFYEKLQTSVLTAHWLSDGWAELVAETFRKVTKLFEAQ